MDTTRQFNLIRASHIEQSHIVKRKESDMIITATTYYADTPISLVVDGRKTIKKIFREAPLVKGFTKPNGSRFKRRDHIAYFNDYTQVSLTGGTYVNMAGEIVFIP